MQTTVKNLEQMMTDGGKAPEGWQVCGVINDDNLTYVAWNEKSQEAIVVDPMREDWNALKTLVDELRDYRFLAVIDTHTHADHVSNAAQLAEYVKAPLIQHQTSPSGRVHLRVSRDTSLPSQAAPVRLLTTPGHTGDSLTVLWGPFLFAGDTILYGDTGRDDLPGGDPEAHYESLQKIKSAAEPSTIFLAGHDGEARASTWATQLKINSALTQRRETFVSEAAAYVGPSPKLLKESLFENFK